MFGKKFSAGHCGGGAHSAGRCGPGARRGRRSVLGAMLLAAAAAVGFQARHAWAHGRGGEGGDRAEGDHPGAMWFKAKIEAHVADALDVAKATPEQRKAVQAELTALFARGKAAFEARHGDRDKALQLFAADTLDNKAIEALQKTMADSRAGHAKELAAAMTRMHDLFKPDQRKAIASYVTENLPSAKGHWQEKMMKFGIERGTERAFDHLQVTPDQRKALTAIRDRSVDQMAARKGEHRKVIDQALVLWQADKLEPAQVQAALDDSAKQSQAMVQWMTQIATEVHHVLTPVQRGKLVEFLKTMHGRFGHGPGRPE